MSFRNLFILSVVLVLFTVFCSAKPKPEPEPEPEPKPNCFPCKTVQPFPQYPQYPQYQQYPIGYGANFYPDNGQQVVGFAPPVHQVQQIQPQFQQLQQLPVQQIQPQFQQVAVQQQAIPVQMPVPQFEYQSQPQPQPQPIQYNQMGLASAPCNQ